MDMEILEWNQVKNYTSADAKVDDLGCWSVWAMTNHEGHATYSKQEQIMKIGEWPS